jgi:single-strand DNA-binding protein
MNQLTTIAQVAEAPKSIGADKVVFNCLIPSTGKESSGEYKADIPMIAVAAYSSLAEVARSLSPGDYVLLIGQVDIVKRDGAAPIVALLCQSIVRGMPAGTRLNDMSIAGRAGGDPDAKYFESGKNKAELSVAAKGGTKDESWFSVVLWDRVAATATDYVKKGSWVELQGSIDYEYWVDRSTGEQRSKLKFNGRRLNLGPKPEKPQAQSARDDFDQYHPPSDARVSHTNKETLAETVPQTRAFAPAPGYDDIPF